jgi:hypothetical protein
VERPHLVLEAHDKLVLMAADLEVVAQLLLQRPALPVVSLVLTVTAAVVAVVLVVQVLQVALAAVALAV